MSDNLESVTVYEIHNRFCGEDGHPCQGHKIINERSAREAFAESSASPSIQELVSTGYVSDRPIDGPTCSVCGAVIAGNKCLSCGKPAPDDEDQRHGSDCSCQGCKPPSSEAAPAEELSEQLQAQLAAYRAMVSHLADIVEACDQAGGALTVTVVREARELLSIPVPATDRWLAERDAKVLRDAANKMEDEIYLSENYIVHADWLRGLADALESRAGTDGGGK